MSETTSPRVEQAKEVQIKLIPKIADQEVQPGTIKIVTDRASLDLLQAAVAKATEITQVNVSTVVTVVTVSKELHKLLGQVESSRKAAKADFLRANKDIDQLAAKVAGPVKAQYDRLTKLLAQWHDAEERRKVEEERKRRETEEAAAAEVRRLAEEEERQRQEIIRRQKEAKTLQEMEQANLELSFLAEEIPVELDLESVDIPSSFEPHKAPIEGAVTTKRYRFTLVDPIAAYQFSKSLVRWELNVLNAQDIVRMQSEKTLEPKIPGIKIETYTDVSTPSARG